MLSVVATWASGEGLHLYSNDNIENNYEKISECLIAHRALVTPSPLARAGRRFDARSQIAIGVEVTFARKRISTIESNPLLRHKPGARSYQAAGVNVVKIRICVLRLW